LTHQPAFQASGCQVAHSLKEALQLAKNYLSESGGDEVMVIGGGKVYDAFIHLCDRIYLTIIAGRFPGTAYFPKHHLGKPEWQVIDWKLIPSDEKNPHNQLYYVLERSKVRELASSIVTGKEMYPVPAKELLEVLEFLGQDSSHSSGKPRSLSRAPLPPR
jgi:hypothetical protein